MSPNKRKAGLAQRTVWVDPETWLAAQAKAATEETNIAVLIRQFLEQYVGQTPTENHPK